MRTWLKPLIFGFLGVVLAVGILAGYQFVQEHRALMVWANQVNGWVQQQQQKQAPVQAPTIPVAKDAKKG